jgi:hypothetical protein
MTKDGVLVWEFTILRKCTFTLAVMKSITKFIPNIIPNGSPSVHSLGDKYQIKSHLLNEDFLI